MLQICDWKLQITNSRFSTSQLPHTLLIHLGQKQSKFRALKQSALIINQHCMVWKQKVLIPYLLQKPFYLSLANDNLQMSQYITKPCINIFNGQKQIKLYLMDKNGNEIGTITATILTSVSSMVKNVINYTGCSSVNYQPSQKVFRILSLIAKLQNKNIEKACIYIQIGNLTIKTPELKSKFGQLMFIEPRQMQLKDQAKIAQVKIYQARSQNSQQQSFPACQTSFDIFDGKINRKLVLFNKGLQSGQIYISGRVVNKDQVKTTNYVQNMNKNSRFSTINKNSLLQKNQNKGAMAIQKFIKESGINMNNRQKYQTIGSQVSTSRYSKNQSLIAHNRRNSMLANNNNIFFSREPRFQRYEDCPNSNVSYLSEINKTFQFDRQGRGGERYKGASIGYGVKSNFIRSGSPGVGSYKLPSIWDRY